MTSPSENKPHLCDGSNHIHLKKNVWERSTPFLKPSPLLVITGGGDLALWFLPHQAFR